MKNACTSNDLISNARTNATTTSTGSSRMNAHEPGAFAASSRMASGARDAVSLQHARVGCRRHLHRDESDDRRARTPLRTECVGGQELQHDDEQHEHQHGHVTAPQLAAAAGVGDPGDGIVRRADPPLGFPGGFIQQGPSPSPVTAAHSLR